MIRSDTIRMAEKAGLSFDRENISPLAKFISLALSCERSFWKKSIDRAVRNEREVCAKMAESISKDFVLGKAIRYRNNI